MARRGIKMYTNEDGTVKEFEKVRVFRGDTTRQVDDSGPSATPADPEKWYYEPRDYEGDMLWSRGYDSYAEAYHAAEAVISESGDHSLD